MVDERTDEPNRGDEHPEIDECPICQHEFGMSWDRIPETTLTAELLADGFTLPPDSELDDAALWKKLHAIIDWMAERRTFLCCTDHLSDRELYRTLIEEILPEPTKDFEKSLSPEVARAWSHYLDVLDPGSDEDMQSFLKYYCDETTRRRWRRNYPDMEIPPKEKPPFDRDRHLPQP